MIFDSLDLFRDKVSKNTGFGKDRDPFDFNMQNGKLNINPNILRFVQFLSKKKLAYFNR
jgi:hypothetical protein